MRSIVLGGVGVALKRAMGFEGVFKTERSARPEE